MHKISKIHIRPRDISEATISKVKKNAVRVQSDHQRFRQKQNICLKATSAATLQLPGGYF